MLTQVSGEAIALSAPTRVAIVASNYNQKYVNALVAGAQSIFESHSPVSSKVIRVPGAFEIPAVAAKCASDSPERFDAILCFGVVLQGATSHAEVIVEAVSRGLIDLQIRYRIPVVHGVYHFENEAVAAERCLDPSNNRGQECGRVALEMAEVMRQL